MMKASLADDFFSVPNISFMMNYGKKVVHGYKDFILQFLISQMNGPSCHRVVILNYQLFLAKKFANFELEFSPTLGWTMAILWL